MAVKVSKIRALFTYDCETGQLFRLRARNFYLLSPVPVTTPTVTVSGRSYRTDRVIWHYVNGRWPNGKLVHVNGDATDNRLDNLAEVYSSPVPGKLVGAHLNRRTGRWYAMISRHGKNKCLGTFGTPEEAHQAYMAARTGRYP
jgi:hypothetical protein